MLYKLTHVNHLPAAESSTSSTVIAPAFLAPCLTLYLPIPDNSRRYQASSDDECTSASEDHDLNHNHPNSLDNPYGEQTKRDDGTMNTRISGALPSRPASRLSNSSSDESSEEVLWIERHFELVTPTTPSFPGHACEHSPCSHRRDSAEDTNSSDSFPFPDVRFVSLPEQSLPSRSFSSPSPSLSMPSNPEFDHISSSCGDPMPTTPTYTYALGMGHDTTPPVHAPAPSMEPPSSPLRFVPRSAVSSANTPVFVAPSPRNNRLQGLTEPQQTGGSIEGKPDVSIAIDFVAEHAQTCRPTFTSCITASDHSVSVRTDARVAFDEDPVRLLHEPRGGSSSPTVTLNATRGGAYSRPVSLSRKLGSFMARRLSVNRGRSNSAGAGSPVFAPPAPLNTIVYDPSVSPEPNQRSLPINQTSARGPPGDVSIGARKRRYTLVLEVDVDVLENSPAVTSALVRPQLPAVPRSPSPRTSSQASPLLSPNNNISFDVEPVSPSYPARVSFSPMPSSPLALFTPETQPAQPHDQQFCHRSDGRRASSSLAPGPTSGFAYDSEPTMTVTIERDAAGPLTRLMRRMSIGRGRQRSATTSFVLASTRVLPVPEHPVERGDIAPDANLDELDSSNIGVAALTPTNEQMRRWST